MGPNGLQEPQLQLQQHQQQQSQHQRQRDQGQSERLGELIQGPPQQSQPHQWNQQQQPQQDQHPVRLTVVVEGERAYVKLVVERQARETQQQEQQARQQHDQQQQQRQQEHHQHQLQHRQRQQHAQESEQGSEQQRPLAAARIGAPAVLQFRLSLDRLRPLAAHEVHLPAAGGAQALNQLIIEMQDGSYVPLPPPERQPSEAGTPGAGAATAVASASLDDASWEVVQRQASLSRAGSAAERQQRFFRWIASSDASVLGGLDEQGPQGRDNERRASHQSAGPSGGGAVSAFAAAAALAGAVYSPPASAGGERSYDACEFASRTRRLVATFEQLREARARASEARVRVEAFVSAPDARVRQGQRLALRRAHAAVGERAARVAEVRQQLAAAREEASAQRRLLSAKVSALIEGAGAKRLVACSAPSRVFCMPIDWRPAGQSDVLQGRRCIGIRCRQRVTLPSSPPPSLLPSRPPAKRTEALLRAHARLQDAHSVLAGPDGRGRWREVHAALVARRNRLVTELGDVFRLGPAPASQLRPSLLAAKLDSDSWWAGDGGINEDGGGGGGNGGGGGGGSGMSTARCARLPW